MALILKWSRIATRNDCKVPVVLSCRQYVLKYVNPKKYSLDEVNVLEDEDPLAVKIVEKHGKAWHLLDEGRHSSLAHAVSGDFDFLKGLSRSFMVHYPETAEFAKQEHSLGSVVVLPNKEHFIYYMIIRENWWDRGAYRSMRESLTAMKEHALENNICSITMGRLGGQDGGLDFREVLKDIKKTFYNTEIALTIYPRRT